MRAYFISKYRQDTNYLTTFLCLQLAHLIISLDNFGRLNKHRFTSSTLIVNNTIDTPLYLRSHWDYQSSVTHRWSRILIYQSVALSCV